jgi:uncharacterized LabA/DUF88 family protein
MSTEKVSVFIDAEYAIQSMRSLRGKPRGYRIAIDDIHWKNIIDFVVKDRTLVSAYYYTSQLDPDENPKTFEHQQHYLAAVQQDIGLGITKMRLQKMVKIRNKTGATWDENRDSHNKAEASNSWVQKGCDTKIILDMLMGAFTNEYDTCVLIAGDSDFTELLETIKEKLNKKCELITFDRYDSRLQGDLPKAATLHNTIDYKIGNHKFWETFEHHNNSINYDTHKKDDAGTMYNAFAGLLKEDGKNK